MAAEPLVVGLIADTHGLVRPGVHTALAGVSAILHAGDVGGDDVLDELALIAPVHAVAGNCDDPSDPRLVPRLVHRAGGVSIGVSHGHEVGSPTPALLAEHYGEDVVVFGHTHAPLVERLGQTLFVNPGAAGPRRFDTRPTVALLTVAGGTPRVEIVPLDAA